MAQAQSSTQFRTHRLFHGSLRRWLRLLGLLLLTLSAAVVALEVGLRVYYQAIPLEVCASDDILGTYYCQPYFVYDKPVRIGYRFRPNMYQEGYWNPADPYLTAAGSETRPSDRDDSFWYVFETDEMGFPNAQNQWQEQYDIIVTGDSFVTRSAPETWIETVQAESGRSILTLGANSWSTLNEVEAVRRYGLDKAPQWVILLYFEGNDLLNTAQYLERQASGLSWREYDLQGVPFWRRLITWHLFRYYVMEARESDTIPQRYRYPVSASTEAGEIETVLKDIHLLPLSAGYEVMAASREFAAVSEALLALRDEVERQGARFLLVYVPSKEHVYWSRIWDPVDVNNILERTVTVALGEAGFLQWQPPYLSYEMFQANHDDQEQLLSDFARENDLEFLNLTPVFWQNTIRQGELYHYADPHWNQAGNRLAAEQILSYIRTAEGGN
jgi:hypothetical protein